MRIAPGGVLRARAVDNESVLYDCAPLTVTWLLLEGGDVDDGNIDDTIFLDNPRARRSGTRPVVSAVKFTEVLFAIEFLSMPFALRKVIAGRQYMRTTTRMTTREKCLVRL